MEVAMTGSFIVWILNVVGAVCFGVVVGWVTSGSLRRAKRNGLTDITTVIGAIGGAAVTGLFAKETGAFGAYCVGLAIGFFFYVDRATKPGAPDWLGEAPPVPADQPGSGGSLPGFAKKP
jgi:formate/nitrite transporter FocA (FNT family)